MKWKKEDLVGPRQLSLRPLTLPDTSCRQSSVFGSYKLLFYQFSPIHLPNLQNPLQKVSVLKKVCINQACECVQIDAGDKRNRGYK